MRLFVKWAAMALLAVSACGGGAKDPSSATEGEELTLHNETGHPVAVYLFQDDGAHTSGEGGSDVQFGHLAVGESKTAHVPSCKFSIVLVDHEDVWHSEFHDCHSTDMVFTQDTGHEHH